MHGRTNNRGNIFFQKWCMQSCFDIWVLLDSMKLEQKYHFFVVEQIDGMRKVYEIFNSTSVDPSVKKSAVDQLAIILQDHNLHAPFKAEGGVETVLKHLKLGLSRKDDVQVVQGFRYGSGFC